MRFTCATLVLFVVSCTVPLQAQNISTVERGKQLLAQRNWAEAIPVFERVLQTNSKNLDARIGLGIARWGLGEKTKAMEAFQQAVAADPRSAQAHYNVALALRDTAQLPQAISEMNRAIALRPRYDDARLALGLMLQASGDVKAGMAQYRTVLKQNPKSAEARNWMGVAYMASKQLPSAIAEFQRAIQIKPDYVRAYNNLGTTLAESGNVADGIEVLRTGLRHAPADLQLNLNLGILLRTSGDAEGAIQQFGHVLKIGSDDPEVRQQLGLALRQKGDLQAAVGEFEAALSLNPEYQDAYYALAQTLRQSAAPTRPPSAEARAHVTAGLEAGRTKNLAEAVRNFRRAIELDPTFADAHYNLGAALWYNGLKAEAVAELDEAIRLNPSGDAYLLRAAAYRDQGKHDAALRMAQRAIALSPRVPVPYLDAGLLLLRLKRPDSAIGLFESGLNLPQNAGVPADIQIAIQELQAHLSTNDSAEGRNVLGRMFGLAGAEPATVIAQFERALKLSPQYAEAHNNLGLVYTQTGDHEKAIAAFRSAIRIVPEYADALSNLGAILTSTDVKEAILRLEKAVAIQPALLKAQYNLALAYGASPSHGPEKEMEALRNLLALDSEYPRADFALGKALLRSGSVAAASKHLENAVRAEPQFGEAQYQLGLALSRLGKADEAAASLKKSRELIAAYQREQTLALDLREGTEALEKGEADEALRKFQRVTTEWPSLADAHYRVGLALRKKQDMNGASVAFRKALELDPGYTPAARALEGLPLTAANQVDGRARFEEMIRDGKFAEVQPLLESYVRDHPDAARAWYALGYSYFAQHKVGDSIKALSKSLSLDVTNAEAHKVLGRNLMIIGRFEEARLEFEIGAKHDPNSAEMRYNLGKLFSIQDQWPAAKQAFEQALKLDANYMEAYDGLGFALEALGDDQGAIASYERSADLNNQRKAGFSAPYVNLSALYTRANDAGKGRIFARKAIEINPASDRAWFQLGKALDKLDSLSEAADAIKKAIDLNSRVSTYHYVLGTLYRRLGKADESRTEMEQFARLDQETNAIEQKRREALRQQGANRD